MVLLSLLFRFFSALQQLFSIPARGISERPAKHLPNLNGSLLISQRAHLGNGAIPIDLFGNVKVRITKGGNLRQVSDANHLMVGSQIPQFFPNNLTTAPTDATVNLIENQGWRRVGCRQDGFQRQHQPRRFATRRDFAQRLKWLARIGCNQKLHPINAGGRKSIGFDGAAWLSLSGGAIRSILLGTLPFEAGAL